jgi:hypothetical protein
MDGIGSPDNVGLINTYISFITLKDRKIQLIIKHSKRIHFLKKGHGIDGVNSRVMDSSLIEDVVLH